ncbi:MAG TPA: autotransporter assembly complex family protein [Gammaproteobacteria bacterium]|nr:autotransporter assembly complex family protein [Gammaproteobacteria bacterium]
MRPCVPDSGTGWQGSATKGDELAFLRSNMRISYSQNEFLRGVPCLAFTLFAVTAARGEVLLTGLEGAMLDNALIHLVLDEEPCDSPEWRVRERYTRASDELRAALEAFGYYSVSIAQSLEFGEACWMASFDVALGEPVYLRNVDVSIEGEASNDPAFSELIRMSTLDPGAPLQHAAYEQLKRRLVERAFQRGYVEAGFSSNRLDVFPQEHAADVELKFDSGPRYTFGEISVSQEVLDESLIEGYYEFRRGDPYDRARLTELYSTLTNSGYFNVIDVRPMPANRETREIPISVSATGLPRRAISYGLGFSTDTGPRFRFGRIDRRVSSRGTQSGVNGQLSPVISELSYNRRLPYGDPRSEWVSFDVGIKHEDTETAVSDTLELGARRVQSRRFGWQETQSINLIIEDFIVGEIESRSRLVMPGISWQKITADSAFRPSRGYRLVLELSGANDDLGSDTTFAQVQAGAKWITSLGESTRLLLRTQLGFTWEENFDVLPPTVRFFAGGDNSIRGFEFDSLGPVDQNGDVIGGDRLLVASAEYEVSFSPRWSGAMFIDSGNAFTGSDFEPRTGAGFGVRWQSPLGPIRFDVAWPINDVEDSPRLHVTLGADL